MGQIRIREGDGLPFIAPRDWTMQRDDFDLVVDDVVEVADTESATAARVHHAGGVTELQLLEVRVPAGMEIEQHAHVSDEIIYVLEGELRLGARAVGPGTSVYIPAWTLYGFAAGPTELRFLNFRGSADVSYVTRDQFLAELWQCDAAPSQAALLDDDPTSYMVFGIGSMGGTVVPPNGGLPDATTEPDR